MRRIEFNDEAFREIEDAESFYEDTAPNVVDDFRRAVNETLDRIRSDPDSYPRMSGNYRVLRVPRFPYLMWYRSIDDSLIAVAAFAHVSRKPGYWRGRWPS